MNPDDSFDEHFKSMTSTAAPIPASQELRDAVLQRTTRTMRTRRRIRRAGIAAAFVACYLGGIATMSLRPAAQHGAMDSAVAARKTVRPEDDQIAADLVRPAANRPTPYERLRRAGDDQLQKYANIPAATRNYKKALQLASSDQRMIAPDHDTWLLMALKQSTNVN